MENIVTIKTIRPFRFVLSAIEEDGKYRLPKSGVRIISDIKDKYAKELRKNTKRNFNVEGLFGVYIIVYNGSEDNLGEGDLDNYSKGILDIITKTKIIWKDDKQVNELHLVRKQIQTKSEIEVIINEI